MDEELVSVPLSALAAVLIQSHRKMLSEASALERFDKDDKKRLSKWVNDSQQRMIKFLVLIKWLSKASTESSAVSVCFC
jgi:hypothetical protein